MDGEFRQRRQRGDGQAQRAERDWAGVGDKTSSRSFYGRYSQSNQYNCTDSDGTAAATQAFQQCAKTKSNENCLYSDVAADGCKRPAENVKMAAGSGEVAQPDRIDAHPDDGKEAGGRSLQGTTKGLRERHPINGNGDQHGNGKRNDCRPSRWPA